MLLAALVATMVPGSTSADVARQTATGTRSPGHEGDETTTVVASGRILSDDVTVVPGSRNQRLSALNDLRQLAATVSTEGPQSSATGGSLFSMEKIRTYDGQRLDASSMQQQEVLAAPAEDKMCERWAVLTSIFEPTDAVRQLASSSNDWCVVVVGDKSGKRRSLSKAAITTVQQ